MPFEWTEFLDENSIAYKREGKDLRLNCPWCDEYSRRGALSISITGKGFYCWNDSDHRGIRNARLVAALLKIEPALARSITGERYQLPDPTRPLDQLVRERLNGPPASNVVSLLSLPSDFHALRDTPAARPFIDYLSRRGLKPAEIMELTERFGVYYARFGEQRYRIVFTVHFAGRLVGWTGRTIGHGVEPRYLASKSEQRRINDYLWRFDQLMQGGDRLLLVEGPFDALVLQLLGQPATCLFTKAVSAAQLDLLHGLLPRWRRATLLLDQGTTAEALEIGREMRSLGVDIGRLPRGTKDPAELKNLDFMHGP